MLDNEHRYFGVQSPRGSYWFNFDPCTYCECATVGSFGGWQGDDDSGRMYVPGEVAVTNESGEITTCIPEDVDNPIYIMPKITWEDFSAFLSDGQLYELLEHVKSSYHGDKPPFTQSVCPVTNEASSLAKYCTACATSAGVPQRSAGMPDR